MKEINLLRENIKQMKNHAEVIRKMGEEFVKTDTGNNKAVGEVIKAISEYFMLNHLAINQLEEAIDFLQKKVTKNMTKKVKNILEYIEMKSKENIFTDYQEALKDKELEAEKELLENEM